MRRIGRYQFRMRTLLVLPAFVALCWWLGLQDLEASFARSVIQQRLADHEKKAIDLDQVAKSSIPEYHEGWACGPEGCRRFKYPLSQKEIEAERQSRAIAGRRAAYHRAMKEKYAWAARYPWFFVAKDPPEP